MSSILRLFLEMRCDVSTQPHHFTMQSHEYMFTAIVFFRNVSFNATAFNRGLQICSLGFFLFYRLCGIKNENTFIFYTAARAAGKGHKGPKGGKTNEPIADMTKDKTPITISHKINRNQRPILNFTTYDICFAP